MYVENSSDPLVQTWIIPGLYLGYPGIIGRKSSALKAPSVVQMDSKSFQLKDFVEVMSSPYFLRKLQSVANMLDAQCVLAQCLLVLKTRQILRQITISLPLRSTENCLVRISFSCRCQAGSGYAANVRLAGCEPAGRVALANLLCLKIWRTNSTSALLHRYQVTSSNLAKPNVLQSLCRAASTKKISWLASTACVELRGSKLRPPRPPVRSVRNADFHRIGHSCSEIVVLFWWLAIKIY